MAQFGWSPRQGRWLRNLRRGGYALAGLCVGYLLLRFGAEHTSPAMDTVPAIPPGSLVLFDRWCAAVAVGSHVLVDAPDLGVLLSQVSAVDADTVSIRHPNANSGWPDSQGFGALPRHALRGVVIATFAAGGVGHGR